MDNACGLCPAGTASPAGVALLTGCTPCTVGTFAADPGSTACATCPPGSYANVAAGAAACTTCEPGKYSSSVGAAGCAACSAGAFSPAGGATSLATCQPCAAGYFSSFEGASSPSVCTVCAAGTFSSRISASACQTCAAGTQPVAAACADGWTNPKGSGYCFRLFLDLELNFTSAEAVCEAHGGTLASIRNAAERSHFFSLSTVSPTTNPPSTPPPPTFSLTFSLGLALADPNPASQTRTTPCRACQHSGRRWRGLG